MKLSETLQNTDITQSGDWFTHNDEGMFYGACAMGTLAIEAGMTPINLHENPKITYIVDEIVFAIHQHFDTPICTPSISKQRLKSAVGSDKANIMFEVHEGEDQLSLYNLIMYLNDELQMSFTEIADVLEKLGL
ncbi:MAG: hypothetical protein AAF125_01380 [Chloroflexota bacterium]